MPCQTCIPISCVEPDIFALYSLNSGLIFRNGQFSFILNCPAGYQCFGPPGTYPHTVIVDPNVLPPIPVPDPVGPDPMPLTIQGCQSVIIRIPPPNATIEQINAIVAEMFALAAQEQAQCDNIKNPPAPGVPPPVFVGSTPPITVYNTIQSFTANCEAPLTGNPSTVVVPAGTYGIGLANPTPASVASIQTTVNNQALAAATAQAQAALVCSAGLNFNDLIWTVITPGLPGFTDILAPSPDGSHFNAYSINANPSFTCESSGTMNYTSAAIIPCNLNVNVSNWATVGGYTEPVINVVVTVDAVPVLTKELFVDTGAVGSFDFAFNVPAGVAAVIVIDVKITVGAGVFFAQFESYSSLTPAV